MNEKAVLARIIPVASDGNGPARTQGTVVMVGDQKLGGVTSITLRCEVNDVWRATIQCNVLPTELTALAMVHQPTFWQRIKRWLGIGMLPS